MTILEHKKSATRHLTPNSLVTLLVTLSLSILGNSAIAQGLSLSVTDDLVPALDTTARMITKVESQYGAYDQRQIEPLGDLGRLSQSTGEYQQALSLFKQALHVSRINHGLYHEEQIPIIDDIIAAEIALRNWESVNNYYAYQEHLYQRLYDMDDPRLEAGLKKVSAWHVNALNVNLDGKRIDHLRKANELFKLRMQIAENTLAVDDPKVAVLAQNIKICERELFLASDLNREMMVREQRDSPSRRQAYRRAERRLIVTLD